MADLTFDHYTIKVSDLERSFVFYKKLGLDEIENRTRKSHIRWFSLGEQKELHLVEGDTSAINTNIGVHLALRLSDFKSFLNLLQELGISPHDSKGNAGKTTTRADGVKQVYFQDPDGYWIEVNGAVAD